MYVCIRCAACAGPLFADFFVFLRERISFSSFVSRRVMVVLTVALPAYLPTYLCSGREQLAVTAGWPGIYTHTHTHSGLCPIIHAESVGHA